MHRMGAPTTSSTWCARCTNGLPIRIGGTLVPEGFHNPFRRRSRHGASSSVTVAVGEPDIALDMAVEFFGVCDGYQLRLFAPMALYGLRASEPCFLFEEHLREDWLDVPCLPEMAYFTKGRREKRCRYCRA